MMNTFQFIGLVGGAGAPNERECEDRPVKTDDDPEWEEHKAKMREIEKKTGLKITVLEKRSRQIEAGTADTRT